MLIKYNYNRGGLNSASVQASLYYNTAWRLSACFQAKPLWLRAYRHGREHKVKCLRATISSNLMGFLAQETGMQTQHKHAHSCQTRQRHNSTGRFSPAKTRRKRMHILSKLTPVQCMEWLLFSSSKEIQCLFGFGRNPNLLFRGYDLSNKLSSYNRDLKNLRWWNMSEKPYIYHCNSRQKADRKDSDNSIRAEGWKKKWEGNRRGG